jgi:mRNA interferase HicA
MKRRDLLRHLTFYGCVILREGGSHSWWYNPILNKRSAVPRHSEIDNNLVQKYVRTLVL